MKITTKNNEFMVAADDVKLEEFILREVVAN